MSFTTLNQPVAPEVVIDFQMGLFTSSLMVVHGFTMHDELLKSGMSGARGTICCSNTIVEARFER